MKATGADYAWVNHWGLSEAYCLTLVRGLSPQQFLESVNAELDDSPRRLDELGELACDASEQYGGARQYIGATAVPGRAGTWTLALEVGGYLGVTEEAVIPVSAGTTVVSHFRDVNALDRFHWIEDGRIRVSFEPLIPGHREGDDPDALLTDMEEIGFNMTGAAEDDIYELISAAAFALAERVTGVAVTEQLLGEAVFTCGIAPIPGMERLTQEANTPRRPQIVKARPNPPIVLIANRPDPDDAPPEGS